MRHFFFICLIVLSAIPTKFFGQTFSGIPTDLRNVVQHSNDKGDLTMIGSYFIGLPYSPNKLSNSVPEKVYFSFDDFDCVTFVENVWALYSSKGIDRKFENKLIQIRYQNQVKYEDRQHYLTTAFDKMVQLNLFSPINNASNSNQILKKIDYLSTYLFKNHIQVDLEKIRVVEKKISIRPFYYFSTKQILQNRIEFKSGDIVGFLSKKSNLDFKHCGFIIFKKGKPFLLHASQEKRVICVSDLSLVDYLIAHPSFLGIQVYRPLFPNDSL